MDLDRKLTHDAVRNNVSARTAFIREEKVNTINCRLAKRNRETVVAISRSDRSGAFVFSAPRKARGAYLADEQSARYGSMQGAGSQRHESGRYTREPLSK